MLAIQILYGLPMLKKKHYIAEDSGTEYNTEQQEAITYGDGPLMIIAGAGTGKTTVITERIKYLIAQKRALPQELLALTFTEKASREMEERVDKALPYGITQLWISTFHAFCDRVLRSDGVQIGLNPGYTLLSEADSTMFFRNHIFAFELEYFRPLGNPNKFVEGMLNHFSRLQDEDVSVTDYKAWVKARKSDPDITAGIDESFIEESKKYEELSRAYELYQQLKLQEGMMDYGDLLSFTLQLFRQRPNVLKKYQQQFKYILIDEFQDTNIAQNQLAVLIAGEHKNITVVGDDDQSIYKWRGAAISNMIQFRTQFPQTKIVVLTKNYRSTKEILDRSYDLIQQNNPNRLEIAEQIEKRLESMRRVNGEPVEFLFADRVEDEAEAVVKVITEQCLSNNEKQYLYKDIAILIRANTHALPFTRALERAGIPYQFLGPGQLFRQSEVKDLIAYLMVLSRIDDTVAFYRILTMDWLDVDPKDVATIVAVAKRQGKTLFEVCETIVRQETVPLFRAETKDKITRLVTMIEKHLTLMRSESAGQILYYFLEETGLLIQLLTYKTERQEQIANNIAAFFDRLKTYETEHEDASVFAVSEWIQLSMELGESPLAANSDWNKNNAVNILTIHSSKGLEFPVVFVVNMVAARFPSLERKEQIPIPEDLVKDILPQGDYHLQEERRLCYVAVTRAKDRLYFTAAKYYGEGKREKKISPFVAETIGLSALTKAEAAPLGTTKQLSLLDFAPHEQKNVSSNMLKNKKESGSLYLSYSQIDTYLNCPLQYKYRYSIKLPVPPSAALSFGDTIHKTLEQFYRAVQENKNPTVDDLLTLYRNLWKSVGYGNKAYEAKMKAHGEYLLRGFYQKGYVAGVVPKQLEESFKLKLTPALTLGGKVDRVDLKPDGKIEIIDYKTGQSTKLKKNVKKDLQLSVYAMAATDQGVYAYRPEDVTVSFYFLESQEKISGNRTKEQLDEARDTIIETAQKIQSGEFLPNPGRHCDFCEFRLICEAWQ